MINDKKYDLFSDVYWRFLLDDLKGCFRILIPRFFNLACMNHISYNNRNNYYGDYL